MPLVLRSCGLTPPAVVVADCMLRIVFATATTSFVFDAPKNPERSCEKVPVQPEPLPGPFRTSEFVSRTIAYLRDDPEKPEYSSPVRFAKPHLAASFLSIEVMPIIETTTFQASLHIEAKTSHIPERTLYAEVDQAATFQTAQGHCKLAMRRCSNSSPTNFVVYAPGMVLHTAPMVTYTASGVP